MSFKSFISMFEMLEGSRKFFLMAIILIVGIIFRLKMLIDGKEFVDLIKICFGAFVAGNLTEHVVNFFKEKVLNKS